MLQGYLDQGSLSMSDTWIIVGAYFDVGRNLLSILHIPKTLGNYGVNVSNAWTRCKLGKSG